MTWRDIIGLSFRNLYRRKSRTLLTVSGVVIGCCAVVIMISLGIGMKKSQEQMLAGMGNLMRITVTSAPQNVTKRSLLDKKGVNKIRKLQNIKSVVPKKVMELGELNLIAGDQARYQCGYVTVVGIPEKDLEDAGYIIKDGKKLTGRPGEVLAGEHLAYQFTDSRRPEGKNMVDYWSDEKAQPYFPILENDIEVAQKNEEKTENSGEGESQGKTSWKTLHKLKTVGVIKQDYDKGEETDSGIIMGMRDFERLQKELRKVVNTKNSREYSQVLVDVDDISHVETVEKEIKKLGYQTSSMESLRKPGRHRNCQYNDYVYSGKDKRNRNFESPGLLAFRYTQRISHRSGNDRFYRRIGRISGELRRFLDHEHIHGCVPYRRQPCGHDE